MRGRGGGGRDKSSDTFEDFDRKSAYIHLGHTRLFAEIYLLKYKINKYVISLFEINSCLHFFFSNQNEMSDGNRYVSKLIYGSRLESQFYSRNIPMKYMMIGDRCMNAKMTIFI